MSRADHADRMRRARLSLAGLSVGDALGECFFYSRYREPERLDRRQTPPAPWRWTDDTAMALGLMEMLERRGRVVQDELATIFARNFARDPRRGYGGGAFRLLSLVAAGESWAKLSPAAFGGEGSMGNGAAMRVAPLGAYFADDLDLAAEQAERSAEVTHWHPEGRAGAVAVAVAAALAWQLRDHGREDRDERLIEGVLQRTPEGETRKGLAAVAELGSSTTVEQAVRRLGNGSRITAPDTVPFCVWSAACHLESYVDAVWSTIRAFGDVDTTCAIVGGIVAVSARRETIPEQWLRSREPLEL